MATAAGRRGPKGSRRVAFWVALFAVAILVVIAITRGGSAPADGAAATTAGTAVPPEPTGPAREVALTKTTGATRAVGPDVDPDAPKPPDLHQVLANYLELARFPPLSRPLGPEQYDLLEPYARHESPVVITEPKGNSRPAPDELYHALYTGDRYALVGTDRAKITFKVWKGEQEGVGVPVQIDGVQVVKLGANGEDDLGAIALPQVEVGGGVAYQGVLDLAALGATEAGEYRVDLYFKDPDGEPVGGRLEFLYTPASVVPARFTGKMRDHVEDGSLMVSVEVDVSHPGKFDFNANLMDAERKPVGWSRAIVELERGKHWIDLPYFGLIFHEQKASGWFQLDQLRGHRMMPGETPDRELMAPPDKTFRTSSYALDDFSSAEWDSPEKREQIEMYEESIREQDQTP